MQKPSGARIRCGLRGNYENAAANYTVGQDWDGYTPAMHDRWRRLHDCQSRLARRYAAPQFLRGLEQLDCADAIPCFENANTILKAATGWQLVAVPGLIPDPSFFEHLSHRRFPVTRWLREEDELGYLVEPDVFHDFFGHVPLLLDPAIADFMALYGEVGLNAMAQDALDMLARLYWYTIEFGLIDEGNGLKVFGSGIVSSAEETVYAITDADVLRLPFDPVRVMRTAYRIDDFQQCYFVLSSLDQLISDLTALDFAQVHNQWGDVKPLAAGQLQPGEQVWRSAGANMEGAMP